MIDHILGRPSPSWKRTQVFLVIFFWLWRIVYGNPGGPRFLWIRHANRALKRFTPWQLIVSTLTGVYAIRNLDKILGFGSPEPLANLYSPAYYRATWIVTGLDAGFATAMTIRPKWLKDLCSVLFAVYYIIYAQEADEKLRRYRAVPTVDMLRATWEKSTNPIIRTLTHLPPVTIRRKVFIPRPKHSSYQRPITAWLFFAPPEHQLARATELILDFPGGGFIAMSPLHHEERLRAWAIRTGKPVLAIDYGKAPEYRYPWAIDESFDAYTVLQASAGKVVGMSGKRLDIVMTGDSAGATLVINVMTKIIESKTSLPHPIALVLSYAALDFNFTSWMSPANMRVLQSEQSTSDLRSLVDIKDHFSHSSPLSMVGERKLRRQRSWRETIRHPFGSMDGATVPPRPVHRRAKTRPDVRRKTVADMEHDRGSMADEEDEAAPPKPERPTVSFHALSQSTLEKQQKELSLSPPPADGLANAERMPLGTRMTMTSRTGYFQDRIITPSMMRAMALLYIGPYRNPDFASDYYLSPILTPRHVLAQFPPLLMQCGEKDPFVDDTVIFAGRVREAKRARKQELEAALAGKSVRFGEGLRMSQTVSRSHEDLRRERDKLAEESEEDWVQMQIFSDWSHGYLQMPTLMKEARRVIDDLADWIDEGFTARREVEVAAGREARKAVRKTAVAPDGTDSEVTESELDDPIMFVPRRGPRRSFAGSDDTAVGRMLSPGPGSDETLREEEVAKPEKAGQTISEGELMRRRRLLDSHMFTSVP